MSELARRWAAGLRGGDSFLRWMTFLLVWKVALAVFLAVMLVTHS